MRRFVSPAVSSPAGWSSSRATAARSSSGSASRLVPALALVLLVAALAASGVTSEPARAAAAPPHVTVIADSVLTAVLWNEEALAVLGRGLDLRMEVGVCRTLTGVSCRFEGTRVPTLLEVVDELGPGLGPTVVVEVGYNDDPATFSESVEQSIEALLAARVKTILWVNLHEWRPQFAGMNEDLVRVAKRYPEVTIVDWNAHASGHYSWFQGDGIHLVHEGAMAIAELLHDEVIESLAPRLAVTTRRLPVARVGVPFATRLSASGGVPPYTWRVTSGPLPRGLRLLANGSIGGRPRTSGRFRLTFRVTDSLGRSATRVVPLSITRRASG